MRPNSFIEFFHADNGKHRTTRLFDIYQTLINFEIQSRLNVRVEPVMSLDQYTSREASERRMRRLGETLAQRRPTFDELAAMPIALRTLVVAFMMPADDRANDHYRERAIIGAAQRTLQK